MLSRKKEIIDEARRKHEDLEFQLMELETRCEAELEKTEEHFQNEQIIITQNSKIRQVKNQSFFFFNKKLFSNIINRILYVILIINKMLFYIK